MSPIPSSLHAYLSAPSLRELWSAARDRLERNGHAIRGVIALRLDDDGADRLSGLLGRLLRAGPARVSLRDLDMALRSSAAARGLVPVVAELTGRPLRDRPAERQATRADREQLWAELDTLLVEHGLATEDWVRPWTEWLHRGGLLARLPAGTAAPTLTVAVRVLAVILKGGRPAMGIAELAAELTGDAHGLDDGAPAAALALRALALTLGAPAPTSAGERRLLWHRAGVSTDEVSGTVITWGLRPTGADRWSAMMRERADLGLVTHLTVQELKRSADLIPASPTIHACENPQVLQRLAVAGVDRPLMCTSGNPAAAGILMLQHAAVRYHGDFDWPGIAIARRIFERGARPWLFGRSDYLEGVERLPQDHRLALSGRAEATPWDDELGRTMSVTDIAVHEEAVVDRLLADLS